MLLEQKIIKIEDKFSLVAEKLDAPITLNQVQLIKENDMASHGYDDAFRGTRGAANTNDEISYEESKLKQAKKDEEAAKKKLALFERFKNEINEKEKALPPVQVKNKNSYHLCIVNHKNIIGAPQQKPRSENTRSPIGQRQRHHRR